MSFVLLFFGCSTAVTCAPGFTAVEGVCYQSTSTGSGDADADADTDADGDADADADTDADTDEASDTGDTGDSATGSPPTVQDVLDTYDTCTLRTPDGRLDLANGCADGACVGMTYDEMVSALGVDALCTPVVSQYGSSLNARVDCDWASGISAYFDDDDQNGKADIGSKAYYLYLYSQFDGVSSDGIGMGVPFGCLLDIYGYPDGVDFAFENTGEFRIEYMDYRVSWDFTAADYADNSTGYYGWDGLIDRMTLY